MHFCHITWGRKFCHCNCASSKISATIMLSPAILLFKWLPLLSVLVIAVVPSWCHLYKHDTHMVTLLEHVKHTLMQPPTDCNSDGTMTFFTITLKPLLSSGTILVSLQITWHPVGIRHWEHGRHHHVTTHKLFHKSSNLHTLTAEKQWYHLGVTSNNMTPRGFKTLRTRKTPSCKQLLVISKKQQLEHKNNLKALVPSTILVLLLKTC